MEFYWGIMSITILIPFISGFCFRLGGVGKDDRFLPFMKPPTPWANKWWRWGMGLPISLILFMTGHGFSSFIYIPTLFIATNVFAYGESAWMAKIFGWWRWPIYGCVLGFAASLSWGIALWLGCVVAIAKRYDLDQSLLEFFILGIGSVIWILFIK